MGWGGGSLRLWGEPGGFQSADRPFGSLTNVLFGDFRLTLAFLRGRGCAWIAALINRPTSGLIRHGNRTAFSFRTWGAFGCAASAGCIVVGRMRDAESQNKKKSASKETRLPGLSRSRVPLSVLADTAANEATLGGAPTWAADIDSTRDWIGCSWRRWVASRQAS